MSSLYLSCVGEPLKRSVRLLSWSMRMPESLTVIVLGLMATTTFVIGTWAALTLVTVPKLRTNRGLYVFFSLFLAAEIVVAFLLRRSFHASYGSTALWGLLCLLALIGSLMLLLLGVAISFARWRERPVGPVMAACLSGALFVGLCIAFLR